jgi:hypothetical protein
MRWLALLLIAPLAACGGHDALDVAQTRYNAATAAHDAAARCREARSVADAYLSRGDSIAYGRWKTTAALICEPA